MGARASVADAVLSALGGDLVLPSERPMANAAVIAIFGYLVPLLTMEINSFRLAVYKGWRHSGGKAAAAAADGDNERAGRDGSPSPQEVLVEDAAAADGDDGSSSSSSAVGHLASEATSALQDGSKQCRHRADALSLQRAYDAIRHASMQAILSSLVAYSLAAAGVALSTRGLDRKVIAIIVGASQFLAAIVVFIVSAKVPQWIGVYHQGAVRLAKCSSNYSEQFEAIDLSVGDGSNLAKLRSSVRLGVCFHFSKFYIILMPFYCGVQEASIPLSITTGAVSGFVLMWAVFVVHEKYIHHRNAVSFTTILLLSIVSSLTFARGMAWIQVVWKLNILRHGDALVVISFFSWLGLLAVVHALFIWHTLRTEEGKGYGNKSETGQDDEGGLRDESRHSTGGDMRRSTSYSSFVFDVRTHFKGGKCQFADHPDLEYDFSNESTDAMTSDPPSADAGGREELGIEMPVAADIEDGNAVAKFDDHETKNKAYSNNQQAGNFNYTPGRKDGRMPLEKKPRSRPAWCEVFVCFSPEYKQSSCLWKIMCWIKILVIMLSHCLCLYFVAVCIGATYQINSTRSKLPAVHEALYDHMNEGPVCAFDNRGPESNITTFEDGPAAREAGFLVLHCGACGACSTWENLVVQHATRDKMAALANECARKALFGGGDDALTECLMQPAIGFGLECALCWQEDILCTKDHCAFIFLQSQMTNNVGNFAVGEEEITSASCEEAHCEVGQFVPCSGATRRRMNIVSSISRPGDQQCGIVDVESWEDLFFGSGVV